LKVTASTKPLRRLAKVHWPKNGSILPPLNSVWPLVGLATHGLPGLATGLTILVMTALLAMIT
jgi:hypothetical protein